MNMKEKLESLGKNSIVLKIAKKEKYKLAATIMGGLLVASALTLFVLPVAYCAIHRIKGEQ